MMNALAHLTSKYAIWMVVSWLSLGSVLAQQCDYVTGPVRLRVSGGNQSDLYSTTYVLADGDGMILQVNESEPFFQVSTANYYTAYALNIRDGENFVGVEPGQFVDQISTVGACFDIGAAYGFLVCDRISNCSYCLGETVTLTVDGQSSPGFTTQFVLADNTGTIIAIQDDPVFENLDVGSYIVWAINYQTDKAIEGLELGRNFARIQSGCIDRSEPYVFGICDEVSAEIRMELSGCSADEQITLTLDDTYASVLWSTGSTDDRISVSSDVPATYTVIVTSENGCQGVDTLMITGDEVVSVGNFIWDDQNNNGRQDSGEPGVNGVTVNLYLDADRDGVADANFPTCTTITGPNPDGSGDPGYYEFIVVPNGYIIEVVFPDGFTATLQDQGGDGLDSDIGIGGRTNTIEVSSGNPLTNVDGGLRLASEMCSSVWLDADADGRREAGEEGVNGVKLYLYNATGLLVDSATTATDDTGMAGAYCFTNIGAEDYYVEIDLPEGSTLSPPNVDLNEANDSDGTGANGPNTTDLITTRAGRTTQSESDFGIYDGGSVCGLVFQDAGDDSSESAIYTAGVDSLIADSQVELIDEATGEVIMITSTDDQGQYCFSAVPQGSYRVRFRAHGDDGAYVEQNVGDDPLIDSDVDTDRNGETGVFFVGVAAELFGVNAGLRMGVLPVDLLDFSAKLDASGYVQLSWSTATEIASDSWSIERVIDNDDDFKEIGTVAAVGESAQRTDYIYLDQDTKRSGQYYYRLKQIDVNGGYQYSHIVAVQILINNEAATSIYPNPASTTIQVDIRVIRDDIASFVVTDVIGREYIQISDVQMYRGQNIVPIDISTLPTGAYLVQMTIGDTKTHNLIQVAR